MKKIVLGLVILTILFFASGCTSNKIAKDFGGNTNIDLPKGEKLLLVTWKNESLWTLTEPMENGYHAKVYKYREHSPYGVIQGTVTIREHEWK